MKFKITTIDGKSFDKTDCNDSLHLFAQVLKDSGGFIFNDEYIPYHMISSIKKVEK